MPEPTVDAVKKFLLDEILASPLAEYLPAEPLRLFLDQYLGMLSPGKALPLEALGSWMASEHYAPPGTVQLIFERLQEKGKKRGIFLLLPGQKPGGDFTAGADSSLGAEPSPQAGGPTFQPENVISLRNRNAFQQLELTGSEKSLLIFLDGRHSLADVSARTRMSLEEIQEFLQKHWDSGFFEMSSALAPAPASPAERTQNFSATSPSARSDLRREPSAKKPGKAKPATGSRRAASPTVEVSGRGKILVIAVAVGLFLAVGYAVYYFHQARGQRLEVKPLNPAEYAALLPFTQVNGVGEVLVGSLQLADWNQLKREAKVEQCRQLFTQAKRNGFSQVQLRDTNGDFLAVIYNEEKISILR